MADVVAWAERFVATPSESRLGNGAIAACAAELCGALELPARIDTADVGGVRHHAVTCDVGPAGAPDGLLLVTHLDTVPPGELAAWTATGGDPFRATREGDRLYGLGSADAKVDFVCKANALAAARSALRRPVRLVGTFGEEIGLLGARWLVESGGTRGMRSALVGEPSELVAIHAHKGYAVFEARVALSRLPTYASGEVRRETLRGVAAHSSSPALGRNAIVAALERIERDDVAGVVSLEGGSAVNVVPDRCEVVLGPLYDRTPLVAFLAAWRSFEAALGARSDARFEPATTVASLGRVAFEGDVAVFRFDVRPIGGDDAERLVARLRDAAEIACVRANPPLDLPADAHLVRAALAAQKSVGLPERAATKATCTEAGLIARAGVEAIVLGAGPSVGNVHKPNEHTRISELHRAVELYGALIRSLACS
jgi:acetylornithine deacetylase/succinyl-diaminopimelate desuccinylase-like protein